MEILQFTNELIFFVDKGRHKDVTLYKEQKVDVSKQANFIHYNAFLIINNTILRLKSTSLPQRTPDCIITVGLVLRPDTLITILIRNLSDSS